MAAVDVYLSEEKIKKRIKEIAQQINRDYQSQELVVVCVLNGAFVFTADLIREIEVPVTMEFLGASSYGDQTTSSGNVKVTLDLKKEIEGKHVLVVEDIVDTGLTISSLMQILKSRNPKSLKLAALLYKPARLKHQVKMDYLAFEIEDQFVIGYGLDFAGRYRELPYIGIYHGDS